jgi:hypothetical protein
MDRITDTSEQPKKIIWWFLSQKSLNKWISIKGLKGIGNLNYGTEQQHISVHTRPLISVTRVGNVGKELDTFRTGK